VKRNFNVKVFKIAGIILAVVILIAAGGIIYLDKNVEKIAEDFLEKEFEKSALSQVYEISYSNVKISLVSGKLIVEDLVISPRESFFIAPDTLRYKYPLVYNIEIPEFSVSGLSENFSLDLEKIILDEIKISTPRITMIDHLSDNEKKLAMPYAESNKADSVKNKRGLGSFNLSGFSVKDGNFNFYSRIKNTTEFTTGKINIEITNLELNPGHFLQTLATKTFESAYVSLGEISYPLENGLYTLEIDEIVNNVGNKKITVNGLKLIPQFDKSAFGKKFGKQTDRLDLVVSTLEIDGFDPEKFLLDNEINIQYIIVDELVLNAYCDKSVPFDYSHFPKYPQQSLAALKMGLNIEKTELKNSTILYEQLAEGAEFPGEVPINNLYATITNVSNIESVIEEKGPMKWDVRANFFDAGLLEIEVLFTNNIHNPDFSFKGKMGEMDMKAFNCMLENTENIRIEYGIIKSMTFYADANENFVEGELVLKYDSLRIAGLRKVREKEKEELGFLSALANVVIRSFNPPRKSKEEPGPATIFFERDKNKGIFNYLAKAMVSGIKATIVPGIGSDKKRYEKGKDKEECQEKKLNRKEERKQKREERKNKGNDDDG